MRCPSKKMLEGFRLWLDDMGEGLKMWAFALSWMLSESEGSSMRGHFVVAQ